MGVFLEAYPDLLTSPRSLNTVYTEHNGTVFPAQQRYLVPHNIEVLSNNRDNGTVFPAQQMHVISLYA